MNRLYRLFLPKKDFTKFDVSRELIQDVENKYDIEKAQIKPIRKVESFVFDISGKSILKVTNTENKSFERIEQICKWQAFLAAKISTIVPVIPSANGNIVEKINLANDSYTAVMYKKAKGKIVTEQSWKDNVFYKTGKLTGRLHALTKDYSDLSLKNHIPYWYNIANIYIDSIRQNKNEMVDRFYSMLNILKSESRSKNNFGIIHNDIHRGNILLQNDELQLFDFDDACQSRFINDIANIFYNVLLNGKKSIPDSKSHFFNFKEHFWKGYFEENSLEPSEFLLLPVCVAIRSIYYYSYLISIGESKNYNPTHQEYFQLNKKFAEYKIERVKPKWFY